MSAFWLRLFWVPIEIFWVPIGEKDKANYILSEQFLDSCFEPFEAFDALFSSEDDVIKYINDFENPKIALQFLEVGEFYHFAKFYYCPNCFPPKRIESCPMCKKTFEMPAFMVLIMTISIMERLSMGLKDFIDFFDWVGQKDVVSYYQTMVESKEIKEYKELVYSLREHWRQEYGSATKITGFFDKFLTKEEKIEFIKSIKYFRKAPELPPRRMVNIEGKSPKEANRIFEEWQRTLEKERQIVFKTDDDVKDFVKRKNFRTTWEALPICFDERSYWKCYSRDPYSGQGQGYCHLSYYCPLIQDENMLEKFFRETIKTIHDWRSTFVHGERLPPISEVAMRSDFYKGKSVIVELTTTQLKPVFEKMLKRYFNQYQRKNKKLSTFFLSRFDLSFKRA